MASAPTPLVYTIPEVAKVLKVGQAAAYELVDAGEIPAVRVWSGGQRVVPRFAVEQFLARLVAAVAEPSSSPSASAASPSVAAAGEGGPGAAGRVRGSARPVVPESPSVTWPTRKTKPRAGTRGSSNTSGQGRTMPAGHAGRTEA